METEYDYNFHPKRKFNWTLLWVILIILLSITGFIVLDMKIF